MRQPDGRWTTISIDGELAERGAGPLADGRLAFLRGLTDGDDGPPSSHAAPADGADPEPRVPGAPTFVVASAETLAYAVATGTVGDPRVPGHRS